MSADNQTPEQQTSEISEKKEKIIRPPLTEEKRNELDHKYEFPERMSGFTCYFGKYREKATFEEVAKDIKYCHFIMALTPKNSNMYLFQKYYKTLPVPVEEVTKKVVKRKTK